MGKISDRSGSLDGNGRIFLVKNKCNQYMGRARREAGICQIRIRELCKWVCWKISSDGSQECRNSLKLHVAMPGEVGKTI